MVCSAAKVCHPAWEWWAVEAVWLGEGKQGWAAGSPQVITVHRSPWQCSHQCPQFSCSQHHWAVISIPRPQSARRRCKSPHICVYISLLCFLI